MKLSQFTDEYLEENRKRGIGNGVTISTFLNGKLKGKAKKYSAGYARSLVKSCEYYVGQAMVIRGVSIQGAMAYYPV